MRRGRPVATLRASVPFPGPLECHRQPRFFASGSAAARLVLVTDALQNDAQKTVFARYGIFFAATSPRAQFNSLAEIKASSSSLREPVRRRPAAHPTVRRPLAVARHFERRPTGSRAAGSSSFIAGSVRERSRFVRNHRASGVVRSIKKMAWATTPIETTGTWPARAQSSRQPKLPRKDPQTDDRPGVRNGSARGSSRRSDGSVR